MRSGKVWTRLVALALFGVTAAPATAQGSGALTSRIELERTLPAVGGQTAGTSYVTPDVVVPGDRVRVTLTFTNQGSSPAAGVNLVNPMPDGLMFDETADPDHFAVSVDGGKSFGALASLSVAAAGAAPRAATAADVTHVRWLWPDAIPPGQSRSVAFFARVR